MPRADATLAAEPDLSVTTYCPATTSPLAAVTGTNDPASAGVAASARVQRQRHNSDDGHERSLYPRSLRNWVVESPSGAVIRG